MYARFAVILATCAVATAGNSASRLPNSPTRCFALRFGKWTIGDEPLDMHRPLPGTVALVDSLFWPAEGGRPAEFWAIRLPADSSGRRRSTWHPDGRNAVELRFPAWWSTGIEMRLVGSGDVLRGRAEIYVDYGPSKPTWALVTARRVACPNSIPIPTLR